MIEKELKVLLDQNEYEKLANKLNFAKDIIQINFYYLDAKEIALAKDITIRIRAVGDQILLQIKVPVEKKDELMPSIRHKEEFEEPIKEIPYSISENVIQRLCGEKIGNVYLSGYMITERLEGKWSDGIKICLDKNFYLKRIDYELEIEYEDKIDDKLLNILKENEIKICSAAKGKKTRYFDNLKK